MNNKSIIILLLTIVLISFFLRLIWINEELGGHHAWGEKFYSRIGLNYLKNNYAPYMAQITEYGYYKNHPPFFSIVESFFIGLFGTSLLALRLGPLIFSLINIILIFLIVNKIGTKEAAIFSSVIYALLPMELYYGFHVDVQGSLLMMFMLISIYLYIKFLNENRFFISLLMSLVLGMFTDWPAYFLSLFIFLDYLFFEFKKTKNKKIFIIPILMLFCFSLFILQNYALSGSFNEVKEQLTKQFIFRSYSRDLLPDYGIDAKFTINQFLIKEFDRFKILFTLPILLLSMFWLIMFFIKNLKYKGLDFSERIILITFLIPFFHISIFLQGAFIHDYWAYYFIAFLSISSSMFLIDLKNYFKKIFPNRIIVFLILLIFGFFLYKTYTSMSYLLECKCIL